MTERLLASWEDAPYVSYDRRSAVVEHRIRLVVYDDGNVDVVHEVRSDDDRADEPAEWTPKEAHEVRGGRVTKTGGRP
ncbi:hypothetical protein [Haloferax sulfurifontis]|uniref:Uncharacterized protein n=2 Tax=Haloferax sulfurifontis TaxID=255616 RepID=M0IMF1_9EURY|nr:hypothetical protein [Haloferax sulfurifontis]ELZ96644.1 hypothetical protein C441_04729 [Haloferax sulfurifontis ATCC BAA-897]GGC72289.1 hypothetical protein GCM10007209_37770 [Haloferax sulfurifontis]